MINGLTGFAVYTAVYENIWTTKSLHLNQFIHYSLWRSIYCNRSPRNEWLNISFVTFLEVQTDFIMNFSVVSKPFLKQVTLNIMFLVIWPSSFSFETCSNVECPFWTRWLPMTCVAWYTQRMRWAGRATLSVFSQPLTLTSIIVFSNRHGITTFSWMSGYANTAGSRLKVSNYVLYYHQTVLCISILSNLVSLFKNHLCWDLWLLFSFLNLLMQFKANNTKLCRSFAWPFSNS